MSGKDDDEFLAYLVSDDQTAATAEPMVHNVKVDDVVQVRPKGSPYDGAFVRVTSVDEHGNIVGYVPVPVPGGMRRVVVRMGANGVHRVGRAVYEDHEAPAKITSKKKAAVPGPKVDQYGYKTY